MASDQERLSGYVATWRGAVDELLSLLRSLDDADWSMPTDLPGWDVKAVVSHLAHLESELAGVEQQPVELPERDHYTVRSSRFTELGVVAREAMSGPEVVDELESSAAMRHEQLLADPPTDGSAPAPRTPFNLSWTWERLLSNRVVDVWMHEQDIRRAVGRPGGLSSAAAEHTVSVFTRGLPFVVGKLVAPPAGTTVVVDVTGVHPVHLALSVSDSGRAEVLTEDPTSPTVALRMDLEGFVLLAGGRRPVEAVGVDVAGDEVLGRRLLEAMAVTG